MRKSRQNMIALMAVLLISKSAWSEGGSSPVPNKDFLEAVVRINCAKEWMGAWPKLQAAKRSARIPEVRSTLEEVAYSQTVKSKLDDLKSKSAPIQASQRKCYEEADSALLRRESKRAECLKFDNDLNALRGEFLQAVTTLVQNALKAKKLDQATFNHPQAGTIPVEAQTTWNPRFTGLDFQLELRFIEKNGKAGFVLGHNFSSIPKSDKEEDHKLEWLVLKDGTWPPFETYAAFFSSPEWARECSWRKPSALRPAASEGLPDARVRENVVKQIQSDYGSVKPVLDGLSDSAGRGKSRRGE